LELRQPKLNSWVHQKKEGVGFLPFYFFFSKKKKKNRKIEATAC
jgi:hypothetical protein